MTEDKLNNWCESYKNWLTLRLDEGKERFLINNLPLYYLFFSTAEEVLKDYEDKEAIDKEAKIYSKMDFFSKLSHANKFFKEINMDVDAEKCVKDGTINPTYVNFDINDFTSYVNGRGEVNAAGHGNVTFPNSGLVMDLIVMLHELGHYANRPGSKEETCILSEAVALYTELKAYDYLNKLGYHNEVAFFKNLRMKNVYKDAKKFSSSTAIFLTYLNFGRVSEENFKELFNNRRYYDTILTIKSEDDFYRIERAFPYAFGILLASYMHETVKNDYSFTQNINVLNKNLNDATFEESLRCLGIASIDEDLLNEMAKDLNNLRESVVPFKAGSK